MSMSSRSSSRASGRGRSTAHERLRQRANFRIEREQQPVPVEGRVDALVVGGPLQHDRPEQLARDGARQLVRPELVDDAQLQVRDERGAGGAARIRPV